MTFSTDHNAIPGFDEAVNLNLSPEMYKITIPVLILWGLQDGVCPVGLADDAYNSIGTPVVDKYRVIFTNSGHSPMMDEPDKFYSELKSFMNNYK